MPKDRTDVDSEKGNAVKDGNDRDSKKGKIGGLWSPGGFSLYLSLFKRGFSNRRVTRREACCESFTALD